MILPAGHSSGEAGCGGDRGSRSLAGDALEDEDGPLGDEQSQVTPSVADGG